MESIERVYLCTTRDLAERARNHIRVFATYYARRNNGRVPHEIEAAEEWLNNEKYRLERELANETSEP